MRSRAPIAALLLLVSLCSQCSNEPPGPPLSAPAERGRKVFATWCSACHNAINPHARGVTGPPVARSSKELLEARILRASYPPGYQPKQAGNTMVALPQVQEHLGDLEAFLAEVPEPKR